MVFIRALIQFFYIVERQRFGFKAIGAAWHIVMQVFGHILSPPIATIDEAIGAAYHVFPQVVLPVSLLRYHLAYPLAGSWVDPAPFQRLY
jgi:hypothetical protein